MLSSRQSMELIGLFGGTFDPVHRGHIQMARSAQSLLGLDTLYLVPCHQPPHRDTPQLTSEQRLALLQLAISDVPGLLIDDRELHRNGPSYTVDTLREWRAEQGDSVSLVLIMGMDAYAQLPSWHEWQSLLSLCHIAVLSRPDYAPPEQGVLHQWLQPSIAPIRQAPAGHVVLLQQPLVPVSATEVRRRLAADENVDDLLSPAVLNYIVQKQLYGYKSSNGFNEKESVNENISHDS